jgi:hypothetical protein
LRERNVAEFFLGGHGRETATAPEERGYQGDMLISDRPMMIPTEVNAEHVGAAMCSSY